MARPDPEALWSDPANWKARVIYYCREDPRVVVPKRKRWSGWTMNFANPWAVPLLLLFIAIASGPMLLLLSSGVENLWLLLGSLAVSIGVIVAVSAALAASR
jgi:hypothetical protein